MPTWASFLRVADAQGVKLHRISPARAAAKGRRPPVRYLRRPGEAPLIVGEFADHEPLTPEYLSALCRRLRIDPAPFGLTLDDLPPADWP
jgi:hypothetical protein